MTASNSKGHGVHSPFVFDFIIRVLNQPNGSFDFSETENLRKQLRNDQRLIEVEDFGAGSTVIKSKQRIIGEIAKSSLKPPKYAQLLHRIASYYRPQHIIELGTSLGITTAYLANSHQKAQVVTFEGSGSIADIAAENLKSLGVRNVDLRVGEFGKTLPVFLSTAPRIDLAFLDGNHRKQPTLDYFSHILPQCNEHSILIFDDIHWSAEMEEAWNEIKAHESVRLSIDLFFIGIVFFRKDFKVKQHFTIRF